MTSNRQNVVPFGISKTKLLKLSLKYKQEGGRNIEEND